MYFLLLFFCVVGVSQGMHGGHDGLSVSLYDTGIFTSFQYQGGEGGGISLDIVLADTGRPVGTEAHLVVLLCTDTEVDNFLLKQYDSHSLCAASPFQLSAGCAFADTVPANTPYNLTFPVSTAITLEYLFSVCPNPQSTDGTFQMLVSSHFHTYNPPGTEELPRGEIPLKAMSPNFAIVWMVAFSLFALNLAYAALWYRHTSLRTLHFLLLLPPVFFAMEGWVGKVYWQKVSSTGVDDLTLSIADTSTWDVASTVLILLVVRLSRGWQITRPKLTAFEDKVTFALALVYLLCWGYWQYSFSIISLFALVVTYALIMQYSVTSTVWSLKLLQLFQSFSASLGSTARGTSAAAGAAPPPPSSSSSSSSYHSLNQDEGGATATESLIGDTPAEQPAGVIDGGLSDRQITFLTRFRYVTGLYITVDILCELASDVLFSQAGAPWVSYLTQQLAALLMYGFFAVSFRARREPGEGPLHDLRGYLQTSGDVNQALLMSSLEGGGEGQEYGMEGGGSSTAAVVAVASMARRSGINEGWAGGEGESGGGNRGGKGGEEEPSHIVINSGGGGGTVIAERLSHSVTVFGRDVPPPPSGYK